MNRVAPEQPAEPTMDAHGRDRIRTAMAFMSSPRGRRAVVIAGTVVTVIVLALLVYAALQGPGYVVAAIIGSTLLATGFVLFAILFLAVAETANRVIAVADQVEQRLSPLQEMISQHEQRQEQLQETVTQHETAIRVANKSIAGLRGQDYITFERRLSHERVQEISSQWSERLGYRIEANYIRYLERKMLQVEAMCHGRVATTTTDVILRSLVARAVGGDRFRGIEIGVLFGINSILLHEAISPFYSSIHLTMIDPLEGYYGADQLDPLTRLPVAESLLRQNLHRWHVPDNHYMIIKGFSADELVLQQVRGRTYDYVLIDGDHSYEGAKADFENYNQMINPGGFLLVDDYGSKEWPGVTQMVDEMITPSEEFEEVGTLSRTAVFRRLR